MKKIIKIVGIIFLLLIIGMIAAPFLFKNSIKNKLIEIANENVNATVSLDDVSLSLFRSFPKADVRLDHFSLVNKDPFAGDTLFAAKELDLQVSISDLISGNYNILGLKVKDASVKIRFNEEGQGNYDIAKASDDSSADDSSTSSDGFDLKIQSYEIENLAFTFQNDESDMLLIINEINHTGKGNFADEILDLDTHTDAKISFGMGKSSYMKKVPITLDAVLGIDLAQQKYSFKENSAVINRLKLAFDGFIQLLDDGQRYDLTFSTPTSSFENFLALIPEEYSKSLDGVSTTGDFSVKGTVKGDMVDEKIPTFSIAMFSDNASFKYPDLPKTVRNIHIDAKVNNTTGLLDNTEVDIDRFAFTIDQDNFSARANIRNVIKNPMVDADLKGTVNLANLKQAYPIALEQKLSGIFKADITTQFDMNSIEKEQYQNVKNEGTASLQQFVYEGEEFVKPFHIEEASLNFSPSHIELSKFVSKTGSSDLNADGRLDNLYGFLFNKEVLKGTFAMKSNKLVVNDFMQNDTEEKPKSETETSTETETQSAGSSLKVPSFLDCTLIANANTVVYDNLQLKNVSGKLIIKDEKVKLENLRSDLFGGVVAITGGVSTKEETATFDVDLSLASLNVTESFSQIEMLSKIAPIAKFVQGKLNSTINVKGKLNDDLTPQISSISGDMLASLLDSKVNSESPLLSSLASQFKGLNLANLNLDNLKAAITFEDGKVKFKPFTIKYNDVTIGVDGSHGFDQSMDYKLTFDVPAKMLGNEATSLLSKLTPEGQTKIENIPVVASVGGTFGSPKVSTDMKQALTNLTAQIAKSQINNLKEKGVDALQKLIGGSSKDSTKTNTSKIIESLTKNSTDSSKTEAKEELKEKVKEKVGDVLRGVLGGKKKSE